MNRPALWLAAIAVVLYVCTPASAQTSHCADCHFAQASGTAPDHLFNWDRSPHGQNGVGCEKCHGGNASVFERSLAHRGVLTSRDRKSPVHAANLPATCGTCHAGPVAFFQRSRHYELLKSGRGHGPTCSTCHDAVSGQLLSPRALESRCSQCHGPNEVAPRADRARHARMMYESLNAVRKEFTLAGAIIRKIEDPQRKADLIEEYEQARIPLTRAIDAGHTFVYDDLERSLNLAQDGVERLMARVVNRTQ